LLSAPPKRDTSGIIVYANDSAWLLSGKRKDPDFGGEYRLATHSNDSFGCLTTTDTSILVFDNPSDMIPLINNPYCGNGKSLDLTRAFRFDGRSPGLYRASWQLLSVRSFPPYPDSPSALIKGTMLSLPVLKSTYHLRYTSDSTTCPFSDSIELFVKDNPVINAGPDTVVMQGEGVVLQVTSQGYPFVWNDGIRNDSRTVLFEQLQKDTVYFTVTIAEGPENCAASDTVRVIGKRPVQYSVRDVSSQVEVLILPESLKITHPDGIRRIICADLQGRILLSKQFPMGDTSPSLVIDVLPPQTCSVVNLETRGGRLYRFKVFMPAKP
jgi:hypothetical protein